MYVGMSDMYVNTFLVSSCLVGFERAFVQELWCFRSKVGKMGSITPLGLATMDYLGWIDPERRGVGGAKIYLG